MTTGLAKGWLSWGAAVHSFCCPLLPGLILITLALCCTSFTGRADEFDSLRLKWRDMLTMGTNFNPADPMYSGWIASIGSTAQSKWASLNTSAGRTYLWSDLSHLSTDSGDITGTYERIRALAMGYSLRGSSLQGNTALRSAITNSLDWMYANFYNENQGEYTNSNFFDWEIGTPLNLNDITVLMYSDLTATQIANYMNAVNHFTPTPDMTGANEVWKALVVAVRGLVVKSNGKLLSARDSLSDVFPYVSSGDGFYTDGSFIFHGNVPYNGGYGAQLIGTIGPLMQLLAGSAWQVTDPMQTNLFRWIYDSFEPFIYRGAIMQMTDGRYFSRRGDDHLEGHDLIASILHIAQFAPPADGAAYTNLIKYWIQSDTYRHFIETQPPPFNVWANGILNDSTIAPASELVRHYQFPHMDQVVHLRPGWGFALSMSSSRIGNYESIRGENLRGWYTGDGMTYLYNADLGQFADDFWSTINPYRLPGTTVDTQSRADGSGEGYSSPNRWVGGASLQDRYGLAGMQLNAWDSTLAAKKSWFMFDDEVVCLGAAITSTDNRTIETIIENRRLAVYGNNSLTVNGAAKPASVGWSETMANTSWAHLEGNVPGSGIGYFFPQAATVKALREPRSGSFYDINTTYGSTDRSTRNYLSLWFDHGANPSNATYAYVLLPNQTAAQVANYAASPDVVVLGNSTTAQGVRETTLGITAINFWKDGTNRLGGVTVDSKCSVIMRNDGTFLELGISDPTQTNNGVINVEITNAVAAATWSADTNVTVLQLAPSIRLAVNVNGSGGQALHVRLFVGAVQTNAVLPAADAYVQNGSESNMNFGASNTLAVKLSGSSQTRETYLRFELPPMSGTILSATLRLVPITLNDPITHALALVSNNSWTESGITWNNKPASEPEWARWFVPATGTSVLVPVTSLAQQSLAADGKLSLRIYSTNIPPPTNGGYTAYASKESGTSANRPQLMLALLRTPPTIVLSNLANDTLFDAPATIRLATGVQDQDGFVTNVAFYSGATRFAQITAAPYNVTLSNVGPGQYTVTAVATDNTGLTSTSAPVTFSVFKPQPDGLGTGLLGEYYTNQNLTGCALATGPYIRLDPTVNFMWGLSSPRASNPSIPADRFSARWMGKLQARHAGIHTFHTVSDEGVRLWINGQLLIDNWVAHTTTEDSRAISLVPGTYYDLKIEYYEGTGNAEATLKWTEPNGTKQVIPQSQLYPADTGLRGAYFAGTNLTNMVFSRIDDTIDFSWGNSSPDPTLLPGSFSVRWTGRVRANQSGSYTFYTRSSDGVRLWVNGTAIINNWTIHSPTESSGTIALVAGEYYYLTNEYFHSTGDATVALMWAPPGEPKQVIPNGNLTPHQNNNPPALAAIPNKIVARGSPLMFTVTAADLDTPAQLFFSLDAGSPGSINSDNGLYTWTPSAAQPLGPVNVTVRVADSGSPRMTDAQTFSITVTAVPAIGVASSGGAVSLRWPYEPYEPGLFRLYTTTNLSSPIAWIAATNTPVLSNGEWVVQIPTVTNRTQFYRLQTP